MTTPAVTYFQSATSSFRASATIVVFLRWPPLRLTRSSNHRALETPCSRSTDPLCHPARLAVAALPARQRARRVVSRARWHAAGHAADRHRCDGEKAADRALALRRDRDDAGGRRDQGGGRRHGLD